MSTPFEQLNDNDVELVSSYIDGEVTATEQAELEARLQREPALRAALEELQATTQLIRELPRMVPPRSFTIDPASVRPRWAGAFGWLRFGSALAAVLLALTVTFDFVSSGGSGMVGSPAPAAMMTQSESAAGGAAESAATSAESAAPAAESSSENMDSNAAGMEAIPTGEAANEAAKDIPPDAAIMAQPPSDEQATAQVQSTDSVASDTLTLRSAEQPTTQSQRGTSATATDEAGGVAASDSSSLGTDTFAQSAAENTPPQPARLLRILEFSLAALALVLGLAALWVARQNRR